MIRRQRNLNGLAHSAAGWNRCWPTTWIDAAIDHDRPLEIPPRSGVIYKGAGRHDAFALCIGHCEGEGDDKPFVANVVRARVPPFDPNEVAREYAELAQAYRINELRGDSFAGEWVHRAVLDAGIGYEKSELTANWRLRHFRPSNRDRLSLPNDEKLVRELRLLERRTHRSGKDSVDHPTGGKRR